MDRIVPVPADFEDCVQQALDQDDKARTIVEIAVEKGLERVYLVGCGGSHFGMYPAFDLLDRYATGIAAQRITSAELTSRDPVELGETSLVVAASHSGNTPETVAAARFAKTKGATVAAISRRGVNGLSEIGDVHLDYPDTITVTEPKLVHNAQVALALLEAGGSSPAVVSAIRKSMGALPSALREMKDEAGDIGERIAGTLEDASLSYVVGGGPAYGMAKMMAWCYLQEMQWLDSAAVNAGDFSHGPFEMILGDTPLIVLVAEDASRQLVERVVSFGGRFTSKLAVLDTAEFSLSGITPAARPDLSLLALMSAERRVLDHVAARRGHDTSLRRYMYRMAY